MLTRVDIQNYRSIHQASVALSPFTLLIGANGTGKSNFLKLLKDASETGIIDSRGMSKSFPSRRHFAFPNDVQKVTIENDQHQKYEIRENAKERSILPELKDVRVFSLDPEKAGISEQLTPSPTIHEDGRGVVQVLDALKTGDREDLFNRIEKTLRQQIPSIKKLSFVPGTNAKRLQAREQCLPNAVPMSVLSEGTRLVLMIIAILYQENKPSLVCIEDIDRGLHPRLFQQIVELCFDLSEREDGVQIIATTHNPYLVDQFEDHESAVVIVEKDDGQTTFTTLADKIGDSDAEEIPLGSLWYSGSVGGVPQGV